MLSRIKQLTTITFSLLLSISILGTGQAAAQSNNQDDDNIIIRGLWAGINAALGIGSSSSNNSNNNSNSNTSSSSSTNNNRSNTRTQPRQANQAQQSSRQQNQKDTGSSTQPSAPSASQGVYAALGDSVAAGAGLPSAANASAQDEQCDRSPEAYPYRVAPAQNLSLVHVACSGATAGDLFTQQRISGPNPTAQLNTAFASGIPELITITAGANDAHWDDFIRACYATSCATDSSTAVANAYLVALQAKLYYLFYDIQARSNGNPPTTIVTGYYNPLSAQCTNLQQNITAEEIAWLNGEVNALNQTIQNVSSRFSFVRFVPVDFTGHDICSSNSWVQGLSDPAPFHPTARGQQAITQAVLSTL